MLVREAMRADARARNLAESPRKRRRSDSSIGMALAMAPRSARLASMVNPANVRDVIRSDPNLGAIDEIGVTVQVDEPCAELRGSGVLGKERCDMRAVQAGWPGGPFEMVDRGIPQAVLTDAEVGPFPTQQRSGCSTRAG